ncbi:hypothetical protein [Nannocystis sp. SCPEA4]|uniref:hypothetical protein n=1 Tax=Nannocystis sp. SCPEA4 TaxID=2996787 RepID=UPI00226DA3F3|nr:hypothetical protein [Nannocystis sp. SCPEA4]MCY1061008.1 hypothetical protein [Nannocystis sp. SCPEA4]
MIARVASLVFVVLATVLLGAPGRARATTCAEPEWQRRGELSVTEDVPVDAHVWRFFHCGFEPEACTLTADGFLGVAEVIDIGSNCSDDGTDLVGFGELVEYVPQQPLVAGRTYTLKCPVTSVWGDVEEQVFTVRTSDTPSAAPEDVELREIRIKRGQDGGCCTNGDELLVALDGLDAPYLREGGRIELRYATGEVFPIGTDAEPEFLLPLPDGPLELTPVAANGVRGTVLRIEPEDIGEREAVYIPCSVGQRHFGAALWLLAPLLWIAGRRRRRA